MRNKNYYFVFAYLLISGILLGNLAGCKNGDKIPVHEEHVDEHKDDSHTTESHVDETEIHLHEGEECQDEENVVEISSKARDIIQLEIGNIAFRSIKKNLNITGEIAQDSEKIFHVTTNQPGTIIEIKSKLGDHIKKGQVIAILKSNIDGKIKEIRAPAPCTITGQTISEGEEVDTLTYLFTISDLSIMKASFDVYEKDISLIKTGQEINIETISYPDKTYPGKIVYISPRVDKKTRTIKIRVDIDNYDHTLKLGMFVKGCVTYSTPKKLLSVPNLAIQRRENENIVFVPLEDNEFEIKEIELGVEGKEFTQVLSGVEIGEEVVSKGSFYLKSESQKSSLGGHEGHGH